MASTCRVALNTHYTRFFVACGVLSVRHAERDCDVDCILPRHLLLHLIRQLLLLAPQIELDEGAVSCSCGEQLRSAGWHGERRGRRGGVRQSRHTGQQRWQTPVQHYSGTGTRTGIPMGSTRRRPKHGCPSGRRRR
eukprot:scaffold58821_cov63-Phaeocystis_antarctica.AAC.3